MHPNYEMNTVPTRSLLVAVSCPILTCETLISKIQITNRHEQQPASLMSITSVKKVYIISL